MEDETWRLTTVTAMRMQSRMARQRFCHVSSLSVGAPMSDPLELGVVISPAIRHLLKQHDTELGDTGLRMKSERNKEEIEKKK
jgi:hypothetical protein